MFTKFWISGFRGIDELTIDDVRRINLLVGPNNVGKTSMLEAIFLLQGPGNPLLTKSLDAFRGLSQELSALDTGWSSLFPKLNSTRPIVIGGKRDAGIEETLTISLSNDWTGAASVLGVNPSLGAGAVAESGDLGLPQTLLYDFSRGPGTRSQTRINVSANQISVQPNVQLDIRPAVFLAARHRSSPEELADRFTKLQDRIGTAELVKSLAILQPGVTGISIGFRLNGQQGRPQLRVHVGDAAPPLPIQLLGEGAARLTEILVTIATIPGGILLVDEIDNGLYYRNLAAAWRAIIQSAMSSNVQIVATTHSAEGVRAAIEAFDGDSGDEFRLYRLEREFGTIRAVTYDYDTAESALQFDLEFR